MINSQKPTVNDVTPIAEALPTKSVSTDLGISLDDPSDTGSMSGPRRPFKRLLGVSLLVVSIIAGILLALHTASANKQHTPLNSNQVDQSLRIKSQAISLANLGLQPISLLSPASNTLTVNGTVSVAGSIVLNPMPTPTAAVAGQLYFDQAKNQLGYYNGSSFIYLQGGGTSVTNNVTNVSNTSNLTNIINNVTNNNGTTGITAINGTAGSIAMFNGLGNLTESLITQSGSNLNTGTGVENVTIGSLSGASSTVVQGGTGNVSINTGAANGISGAITIQSGDSATTAAGNVTIDTGNSIISGTQIANKTFEGGIDNMGDNIYGNNSTVTQSTAEAHGGTHSLAVAVGSNFFPRWGVGDGATTNPPLSILVTAGHTYELQAWVRADTNSDDITASAVWSNDGYGGGGFISEQSFGTVTDINSGWRKVAGELTAPVGAQNMGFDFQSYNAQSVGEVHYFDDITITDLSSSNTDAALNLGTTNAQVINIGNSGLLAPTSIYGGGVNIVGGSGFINESGGYLNVTGDTGGSIATNTGALTLSSGTTASWGVSSNLLGNDLTVHAGSAGGNNNGGNLILQSGAAGGIGAGGSIIAQSQTDSTTAFQVRNSSGNTLLNVDTTNSAVDLATTGGSLNVGSVTSDNTFGYTGVGATQDNGYHDLISGEQFTASHTGALSSLSTYIGGNVEASPGNEIQLALYADSGSNAPSTYIASTAVSTISPNNWNTLPITANVTAGTKYWLVFWTNTSNSSDNGMNWGNTSGQTYYYAYTNGVTFGSGADNGMPATFPGPSSDSSVAASHSIYASYGSATGTAFNIDTAGNLHQSGSATFADTTSSTTAFQVQDTSGNNLLNVDTTSNQVNIGKGAGTSLGNSSIGPATGGGSGPDIMSAQKVTTTSGGAIASMSVHQDGDALASPNNLYQLAIFSDNSGQPGNYIASSAVSTLSNTAGWYTLPISATLSPSTTYWLVYWQDCSSSCGSDNSYSYNFPVGGAVNDAGSYAWQNGPDNGFPAMFPTITASYSGPDASLYATYASSGPALTLNALGALTQSGAALFQDPTDTTVAFQIQNSLGTALLTANTADMIVTVTNFVTTGTFTVDGHIITGGNTPQIAASAAACTTPTVSINGTDTAGTLTVTTGTGCSSNGTLASVTFASAFSANPHVSLTPGGSTALTLGVYVDDATVSTTGFSIATNATPANATTYQWNYQVLQ